MANNNAYKRNSLLNILNIYFIKTYIKRIYLIKSYTKREFKIYLKFFIFALYIGINTILIAYNIVELV